MSDVFLLKVILPLKWEPPELEMCLVNPIWKIRRWNMKTKQIHTGPLAQRLKEIETSKDVRAVSRMARAPSVSEPSHPDPHPGLGDTALTPLLPTAPLSCSRASLLSLQHTQHTPP